MVETKNGYLTVSSQIKSDEKRFFVSGLEVGLLFYSPLHRQVDRMSGRFQQTSPSTFSLFRRTSATTWVLEEYREPDIREILNMAAIRQLTTDGEELFLPLYAGINK